MTMKKQGKRLLACMLIFILLFTVGCGGNKDKTSADSSKETSQNLENESNKEQLESDSDVSNQEDSLKDGDLTNQDGAEGDKTSTVEDTKADNKTDKKQETGTTKKEETTTAKQPETTTSKKEETTKLTCTISIDCKTILDNMDKLNKAKKPFVPADGVILTKTTVAFEEGESVHDILKRVCKSKGIQMESSYTPIYDSAYIEGINQLYEFDCGAESGWNYKVNGWIPNYGCSQYIVEDGDDIAWVYTCNMGEDIDN